MIAARLKGRDNNFNLLRMIAASMVIVSHSWPLKFGATTKQPLQEFPFFFFSRPVTFTLGILAVQVFFIISGFLITQSFMRLNRPGFFGGSIT
jgi:peptidoglycan/LPS O-acetylase OafA/YrhL